jgi:hypothetical protein
MKRDGYGLSWPGIVENISPKRCGRISATFDVKHTPTVLDFDAVMY